MVPEETAVGCGRGLRGALSQLWRTDCGGIPVVTSRYASHGSPRRATHAHPSMMSTTPRRLISSRQDAAITFTLRYLILPYVVFIRLHG